jgi:structural protein of head
MLQDALAIYRIARAPERRVFYIDVGNLPPAKAQEQVNRIMQSVKNRTIYNSTDGTVSNQYNNMNMMEDFWLTRRDGNAKTEVQALPGAQQLGETGDIEWISQKLYEALRIPLSRIPNAQNQSMFTNGSEITRDELSF